MKGGIVSKSVRICHDKGKELVILFKHNPDLKKVIDKAAKAIIHNNGVGRSI